MRSNQWFGARLTDAVECHEKKNWPTPTTRDYKDTGKMEELAKYSYKKRLGCSVAETELESGQETPPKRIPKLNPMWVEWLMGFPIGWTD